MSSDTAVIAKSLRPRGPVTLKLLRRQQPDAVLLEVGGELDVLTAARLGVALDREVRGGKGDVLVDLCSTEFVDSAGLHILLNAQRRLRRQGRDLSVLCPPGPVRHVFELARLVETLGLVASLREYRRAAALRADRSH